MGWWKYYHCLLPVISSIYCYLFYQFLPTISSPPSLILLLFYLRYFECCGHVSKGLHVFWFPQILPLMGNYIGSWDAMPHHRDGLIGGIQTSHKRVGFESCWWHGQFLHFPIAFPDFPIPSPPRDVGIPDGYLSVWFKNQDCCFISIDEVICKN